MRAVYFRQFISSILMMLLLQPPAAAFDTFWHSAATSAAAREYGFSDDAANVIQFGNFSGPDFFGPLYDSVGGEVFEHWQNTSPMYPTLNKFLNLRSQDYKVRKMAVFMHFDNLNGKLDSNAKFDLLFYRLLYNTQQLLDSIAAQPNVPEGYRKIAILSTLGSSLHMVQDFYSHSDWTHNDFAKLGVPLVQTKWGKMRAPTWFEVRAKLGRPEKWPFQVHSGVYPPKAGASNTHSHMNHDNSQLVYKEDENPGKPKNSQVAYHNAGPFPASDANAKEHQLFAANSAAGASIEWIAMVMADPAARAAIESARTWDIKKGNPAMLHDLEGALGSTLLLSCALYKWDGFNPPPPRVAECKALLGLVPAATTAMAVLPNYHGVIPDPANEFWGVQLKFSIVDKLATGFGSDSGDYNFDFSSLASHMPQGVSY